MNRGTGGLIGAMLLTAGAARSQTPLANAGVVNEPTEAAEQSMARPGYFDGLGTKERNTSIQSNTGFGTARVLTQYWDLAHAWHIGDDLALVTRVNVAVETDTTSGDSYTIQGPIASLGVRAKSPAGNYWMEFGGRLVPGWNDPNAEKPATLNLALNATLTSGIADDARWLAFANTGVQVYGAVQGRAAMVNTPQNTAVIGVIYGGQTSLAPLEVRSWLGPQRGLIGNLFFELFVTTPRLANRTFNVQFGLHGDMSLSSIWPGADPLPVHADMFVGWSPVSAFAVRVFGGVAGSPAPTATIPWNVPYGVRIEYFVP